MTREGEYQEEGSRDVRHLAKALQRHFASERMCIVTSIRQAIAAKALTVREVGSALALLSDSEVTMASHSALPWLRRSAAPRDVSALRTALLGWLIGRAFNTPFHGRFYKHSHYPTAFLEVELSPDITLDELMDREKQDGDGDTTIDPVDSSTSSVDSSSAGSVGSSTTTETEGEEEEEEPTPRPPDTAPIEERLEWVTEEYGRKVRMRNACLERLRLEQALMTFFFGATVTSELERNRQITRLRDWLRSRRQPRQVIDNFIDALRRGDRIALRIMLKHHSWLRVTVFRFLLRRFHIIGALLAAVDLAPLLRDWWCATTCESEIAELELLRWRWLIEQGSSMGPGETGQFGPYVVPDNLPEPPDEECVHQVEYWFVWLTASDNEERWTMISGPHDLEPAPGEDGLPAGALTDEQSIPLPTEVPADMTWGYVYYKFILKCPGQDQVVTWVVAVAIRPAGQSSQSGD